MAQIKKSMTVMDVRNVTYYQTGKDFEIIKLTNLVDYEIGQTLSKTDLRQIIHGGTKVDVVPCKQK